MVDDLDRGPAGRGRTKGTAGCVVECFPGVGSMSVFRAVFSFLYGSSAPVKFEKLKQDLATAKALLPEAKWSDFQAQFDYARGPFTCSVKPLSKGSHYR